MRYERYIIQMNIQILRKWLHIALSSVGFRVFREFDEGHWSIPRLAKQSKSFFQSTFNEFVGAMDKSPASGRLQEMGQSRRSIARRQEHNCKARPDDAGNARPCSDHIYGSGAFSSRKPAQNDEELTGHGKNTNNRPFC